MSETVQKHIVSTDLASLFDRLDRISSKFDKSKNVELTSRIAISLCKSIIGYLDQSQRDAIHEAELSWNSNEDSNAKKFIALFSNRIKDKTKLLDKKHAAIDRLVWTSLNKNTEFSSFACEFLINIAIDAGVDLSSIETAFLDNLTTQ